MRREFSRNIASSASMAVPIGLTATWSRKLLQAEGRVIGIEARARYNQAQRDLNAARHFSLTRRTVAVRVRKDGGRAGGEVAQLYALPVDRRDLPRPSLTGFERIALANAKAKSIRFERGPRDMAFVDRAGFMRVTPGCGRAWVEGGREEAGASGAVTEFRVDGSKKMPQ